MKQKVVKKVLMCKPLYFSVDYVINPWMHPGTVDRKKAIAEWDSLVQAYKDQGIKVEIIAQEKTVPDMVFAADQGLVHEKNVLLSRFRFKERKPESTFYEKWFKNKDYRITYLPNDICFEGNGESYFWNDIVFVGTGYRSDKNAPKFLAQFYDREVIPLEIVDPAFYHLDMGFFPLNQETVFYYPSAYSEKTRKLLKKKIPQLIELTKEEAQGFAANSVVTDHHVICQQGNPTFEKNLHNLGYKTVPVDLGEFKKSGGGAHCLTNVLEESIE